MGRFCSAIATVAWTGALAVVLTAVTGGIWTGLLIANLSSTPALPWSVAAMAAIGWAIWNYLAGGWWPTATQAARRALLRARAVPAGQFAIALIAGALCLVSLSGLWIVLFELVKVSGNSAPDFSHYPVATVAATLVTAALVGAVFEEGGFRGYFQGTLEKYLPGPVAILICALVMAPEHAATQGFVWPTMFFYLLVDVMLGFSAALTKSILPGIVIHAAGLLIFFGIVWPGDHARVLIWQHGPDMWFWLHGAQIIVFGVPGIMMFVRLARMARGKKTVLRTPSAFASVRAE